MHRDNNFLWTSSSSKAAYLTMNNPNTHQNAVSESSDEKLSVMASHDFGNEALHMTDISSMSIKPPLMNVRAGSLGMLDASLFEFGQTAGKPKQPSGCEVDMNLPFPIKLHYILSQPNYHDCISWLPHGRAWKVTNQKLFESKIIPRFFRSDKMASFMRQVNGWAFNRITEGPDMNAYYHEVSVFLPRCIPNGIILSAGSHTNYLLLSQMFLRGLPNLCFDMKRPPKIKHAAATARLAAGAGLGAPDFDRISKIAPLPASFFFKPILKDTKGESSDKYGLEISDADESFRLSPSKSDQKHPSETIESSQQGGQVMDDPDVTELCLTKADVHYLKHQNEILFQQGSSSMKMSSFSSRQA